MSRHAPISDFWRRLTEMIGKDVTVGQKEVAKLFKVGQSSVTKWKTGKDTPSFPRTIDMAKDHGVSVEWLLTGRGPKYPGGAPDAYLSRLLDLWDKCPIDAKREVMEFAQFKCATRQP